MKILMLYAFAVMLLYACNGSVSGSGSSPDSTSSVKVDSTKKNYIPIGDYLKNEIGIVDSTPCLIMLYHVKNGKTDSAIIKTKDFDDLAKVFLRKELDSPAFENSFTENSFMDRTTNQLNFTYNTKDSVGGLKRVDFLASPTPAEAERMNSVYMEIEDLKKDTNEINKLFWKAGSYFTILRISQPINGQALISQTKVVWGSRD
jgi:hypothetical protein